MVPGSLYRFPAQMASFDAMAAHLRAQAEQVGSAAVLRAETVLEELLSNSIQHGAASAPAHGDVWLGATVRDGSLVVRYEDPFAPFDPMACIDAALRRTANPMDQRPLGGLGLLMVFRMADDFVYVHEDGRNRIDVRFAGEHAA